VSGVSRRATPVFGSARSGQSRVSASEQPTALKRHTNATDGSHTVLHRAIANRLYVAEELKGMAARLLYLADALLRQLRLHRTAASWSRKGRSVADRRSAPKVQCREAQGQRAPLAPPWGTVINRDLHAESVRQHISDTGRTMSLAASRTLSACKSGTVPV